MYFHFPRRWGPTSISWSVPTKPAGHPVSADKSWLVLMLTILLLLPYYSASTSIHYMRSCVGVEDIYCMYKVVASTDGVTGSTHCRVYSCIHKSSLDVDMVGIGDHNHKLKTMAAERTMAKWCEIDGTWRLLSVTYTSRYWLAKFGN
jgi:hypothetical protein